MSNRVVISLEDIGLTFGGKPLFEGLSINVYDDDKICLVGKNGAGKTTLMRLVTGELDQDKGLRYALPGLRIGYLEQKVTYDPNQTVKEYVLSGINLRPDEHIEEKQHLADMVMEPLDLKPEPLISTLSGGQLRRAALARALVEQPDVLLLDEPTNHLDLGAIEWLEKFLQNYRGAMVCVSHDRTFLANISKKVFWIDAGKIRTCPLGYREFDEWLEKELEQEARALHNMQKKMNAEIDWTQGGVTGRRKRNIRRMNELHKLREKIRQAKAAYNNKLRKIELDPLEIPTSSKRVAEFKHVSKSFHHSGKEIPILKDFGLTILKGDRIGILGKNGSGKSTFLKLLAGELEPDQGRIHRSKTIDISYFDQNRTDLDPKKTLWETLCPTGGDHVYVGMGEEKSPRHVCGYLKQFLFDPKVALEKVGTLSGGQQNRLMLAKILASPGNVLILDEPTNDLDMDTLDMLQEMLLDYPGTLILVSHDRDFLDRTVTEVLAFEGDGKVESHIGGYTDYLEAVKKEKKEEKKLAAEKLPQKDIPIIPVKKSGGKITYKLKHELETLPEKIADLEEKVRLLKFILNNDRDLYSKNPERFNSVTGDLGKAIAELEMAEHRWLELEELRAGSE